jgi:hypothetical protein
MVKASFQPSSLITEKDNKIKYFKASPLTNVRAIGLL